jgi:hypothetical protein
MFANAIYRSLGRITVWTVVGYTLLYLVTEAIGRFM